MKRGATTVPQNEAAASISMERPKVSIITVVFNGKDHIEATIRSVLGQDYSCLEYIVIDGGSTDGTVDIIRQYEAGIAYWRSEKDCGIYDAMNKGLATATGAWVNFMNAGDEFYACTTVSNIFGMATQGAAVLYGGVEIKYPDFTRVAQPGKPANLWRGMQFSHQSAFIDLRYHKANPFNISNRIAADLEFFYRAYQSGERFVETGQIVSRVNTGGVSEVNRVKTIMASRDAICGTGFRPFVRLYFLARTISAMIRTVAKQLLPKSVVKRLILLK